MYMNDGNKTKINLRNKSVFITGVAGFIGSNLPQAGRWLHTPVHVRLLKYFRLLEGSAVDICRPFLYTILIVVAFSQPQLTTKNEIGNPFWGSLSHFFVGAILQQHL